MNCEVIKWDFGVIQLMINISWRGILIWAELMRLVICLSACCKTMTQGFPMIISSDCSEMTLPLSSTQNWKERTLIGEKRVYYATYLILSRKLFLASCLYYELQGYDWHLQNYLLAGKVSCAKNMSQFWRFSPKGRFQTSHIFELYHSIFWSDHELKCWNWVGWVCWGVVWNVAVGWDELMSKLS